jgi:hypothetical protein
MGNLGVAAVMTLDRLDSEFPSNGRCSPVSHEFTIPRRMVAYLVVDAFVEQHTE